MYFKKFTLLSKTFAKSKQRMESNLMRSNFCNGSFNSTINKTCEESSIKESFKSDLSLKYSSTNMNEKILENQESILFIDSSSEITTTQSSRCRKILISERLLKTEKIWYLPNVEQNAIMNRLKNKPIGV